MNNKTISDKYIKLSQREHVLTRPDTYIGSVNKEFKSIYVATNYSENIKDTKMIYESYEYTPAFIKIFDEAITNASDHAIRTGEVTYIKVNIINDIISVENDGPGVPVIMHDKEHIYIPELVFGHLLSGENFNDMEQRYLGGRNGIGIKCTNIYSKSFLLETSDGIKSYKQEFTDNMSVVNTPKVKKCKQSYTKVTYKPDFEKFSMTEIDDVTLSILVKRIIDIAAYNPTVKVYFNEQIVPIKTFKDYIKLFTSENDEIFYEKVNENWEVGVIKSPIDAFTQVSMVNGISTILGGTHVNFVTNNLVVPLKEQLERGVKGLNIKVNDIKGRVLLFVNSRLPNPTFDTQTKENLTLRLTSQLTKDVKISDSLIKKLSKSDIFTDLVELSLMKEKLDAQKELNKQVGKRIRVEKLFDANNAGKLGRSSGCYLFITEGDSARNFAVAGFSITGRDNYGCFPIRGKSLNVRGVALQKIKDNDELKNIIQILGLEFGKKYKSTSELRYGKVVLTSDSDTDGYHIKGLLINFFEIFWPELLKLDFIYEFVTPIIIATNGKRKKFFYKQNEYDKWCSEIGNLSAYNIKYYKGLGTLGPQLGKELFKDLDKHLIPFHYSNPERTKDLIDLAFNKKRPDDRKEWLSNYVLNASFDKFAQKTTFESFMDNEFIEYSMEDNVRSIPSIVDGFKPSQRKILYTLMKLNKTGEMNVGELFGYVKSTAEYHHGPQSLEQGIISMAQEFIGSNNLSILEPLGSFGTRISGGKDSSAARYIYTKLRDITKDIFMKEDGDILNYLDVDGKKVEPDYYLPIIPQVLLNGVEGIGTGWSSTIPKFKCEDLIEYIDNKISGKKKNIELLPFYENFTGTSYYDKENNNFMTRGTIKKINDSTLNITELPINVWNDNYYLTLEEMIDDKIIKNFQKNCTDEKVNIKIKIQNEILSSFSDDELYTKFDLDSKINMSNMHLFNADGKIKKYNDQYEIIDEYYSIRLEGYQKRKDSLLSKFYNKKIWYDNTIKFIKLVLKDEIKINNVGIDKIIQSLQKNDIAEIDGGYNYLLNIAIYKLTREELVKLRDNYRELKENIKELEEDTPEKMWHNDLIKLRASLKKYRNNK